MKNKGAIITMTALVSTIIIVSLVLYILDQEQAIISLMGVIVISAVYLLGMDRNHREHSKRHY